MDSVKRCAGMVVVGTVLLTAGAGAKGGPPARADNPLVSVTFDNRAGDKVLGLPDAQGNDEYRHGLDGVEAQIWRGGSEDLTLRLYYKNTSRRIQIINDDPQAGPHNEGWFMNVRQIGALLVGETRTTNAVFQTYLNGPVSRRDPSPQQGIFKWCGDTALDPTRCVDQGDPASAVVSVTRTSANQWTVTTDALVGGGVVAAYYESTKNGWTFKDHWNLPFALKVECIDYCY